ncbi:MAG: hypothetical protein Q4A84_05050 [Neisseria sp.]|uniref:hypothetical protein n=1 Tax=Neisseria sp. TaxID=192066 RepID=UPI0026DAE713|nr:hypothetical protein [Neisseria sp.]MDO4641057.1 hypothetical protein [Neisseria sp.]
MMWTKQLMAVELFGRMRAALCTASSGVLAGIDKTIFSASLYLLYSGIPSHCQPFNKLFRFLTR